ncbi:MAG: methylamine utilization protein MauE [Geminicoccaceae bacterium]|nr:methylamine utilization protein MauE [Geminicoccaceae bacterium]MCX7631223.1 methylamine utilization protein MauE [Geminicoccaceae bacterium]MDW8369523.1 MauE/DoxX family redox-associated membrane protein [Geminicoccaceae bacterium]
MLSTSALLAEPALHTAAWATLAAVFALALPGKLRDFAAFAATVANYRIVPAGASPAVAAAVVAGELAVVAGLVLPASRAAAAGLAAALLAIFTVAIAVNLLRGRRTIDCGCFRGLIRERLGWSHVARNLLLLAAAVHVATIGPQPAGPLDLALGAAAALTLLLLFLAGAQLAFDPRHDLVLADGDPRAIPGRAS